MKKIIQNSLVIALLLSAPMVSVHAASSDKAPAGKQSAPSNANPMMQGRMAAIKARLELTPEQEKKFDAFAEQKQKMMQMMKQHRHAMMGGARSATADNGKAKEKQPGAFEKMMTAMSKQAEQMQATSKAGTAFYQSLTPKQQEIMNRMPEEMRGQMRSHMQEMMRRQARMNGPMDRRWGGPRHDTMHDPRYAPPPRR